MGNFDEVDIGGINWQTKALGKTLQTRVPGDSVEVQRVASRDDPSEVEAYAYDDLPHRYLVEVHAVEYLLIEGGRIVGLATDADREALNTDTFDYYGHDVHDEATVAIGGEPRRPPRPTTPIKRPPPRPRRA